MCGFGWGCQFTHLTLQGQEEELDDSMRISAALEMQGAGGGGRLASSLQVLCTFEQQLYESDLHDRYVATQSMMQRKRNCNTLNHGPDAKASCAGKAGDVNHSFHHWLCLKCGYEQYSVNCLNKCDWGQFGWTCIGTTCVGANCGCKKGDSYWMQHGADWQIATV